MKRLCVVLFAAILFLTACRQDASWQEQYDLGVRYLSEGNYEEAIIAFTAAIEIDPRQAPAYLGRGEASMALFAVDDENMELLRQAADDFIEVITIDPSIIEAYSKLSDVYIKLDNIEKAINILQEGFAATGDLTLRDAQEDLMSLYSSVEFSIDRQNIYYTSEITGFTTPLHYDLITVKGEGPRINKINRAIIEDFERFKTAGGAEAANTNLYSIGVRHEWMYNILNSAYIVDMGSYYMPGEVNAAITCNESGILSIRYTAHYIYDYSCEYGMTFDLLTGEQLSYMEYFHEDRGTVRAKIRTQLQTIIDEQWAMGLDGVETALEEDFDYSLLDFYIRNRELIVCSPRMFAGDGSVWTTAIPCGVYIDEWKIKASESSVVSIERKDHSILNPDGSVSVELYYDLPVVEGDTSAIKRINSVFEESYDAYVSAISRNWETYSYFAENKLYPEEYFDTLSAAVTYNEDNVLSIVHMEAWYMGGVLNDGYTGKVFDLKTGRQLGLRDLFYRDDDSLLTTIKDKITAYVNANFYWGADNSIIATYTLDNLEFYIAENRELIICIPEYELADGAAGALQIPCDLYIGRD